MRTNTAVYENANGEWGRVNRSASPYSRAAVMAPPAAEPTMIKRMSARLHNSLPPMPTKRPGKGIDYAALVRGEYRPVAQRVAPTPSKPVVLAKYSPGPVGFLQWLAAVHPQLYAGVRKNHPELLTQAHAITAQIEAKNAPSVPECPGCQHPLSGLGDWTDSIGSWVTSATGIISGLANSYTSVKQAIAGPQIQTQLQQASQGQPPVNYGGAPAIPPGATVVTSATGGFGKMGLMIGLGAAALIGGLVLFKK